MKPKFLSSSFKCFLFDMDGTLFDSEDLTHDIFSKIASGFGKRLTEKDHSHVLGSAEPFWSSYFVEKWKLSIDPKEFAKL